MMLLLFFFFFLLVFVFRFVSTRVFTNRFRPDQQSAYLNFKIVLNKFIEGLPNWLMRTLTLGSLSVLGVFFIIPLLFYFLLITGLIVFVVNEITLICALLLYIAAITYLVYKSILRNREVAQTNVRTLILNMAAITVWGCLMSLPIILKSFFIEFILEFFVMVPIYIWYVCAISYLAYKSIPHNQNIFRTNINGSVVLVWGGLMGLLIFTGIINYWIYLISLW